VSNSDLLASIYSPSPVCGAVAATVSVSGPGVSFQPLKFKWNSASPPPGTGPGGWGVCTAEACLSACFIDPATGGYGWMAAGNGLTCWQAQQYNPTSPVIAWGTLMQTQEQVIDLNHAADQQSITLTLSVAGSILNSSGTPISYPLRVNASLDGDVQFVMTQTSSSFRPVDARDPAGTPYCPVLGFDPANGTNDDCHPTFCVGLSSGGGALPEGCQWV